MRIRLAHKIGILAIFSIILVATIVGRLVYGISINVLIEHERVDLKDEAHLRAEWVRTIISTLREDVSQLSRLTTVDEIVRLRRANPGAKDPVDPKSGKNLNELRSLLSDAFEQACYDELGHPKPYLQIRLIEKQSAHADVSAVTKPEHARELVRVCLSDNLDFESVPTEELDMDEKYLKGDAPYFLATWELAAQSSRATVPPIFLSDVELNVDNGETEFDKPVLRAATPVYDADNRFFGIIVINLDFHQISRELSQRPRHLVYLTNERGDFLVHPNKDKEFVWNDERKQEKLGRSFVRIQDEPEFDNLDSMYPQFTETGATSAEYVEETASTVGGFFIYRKLEEQGYRFRDDFSPTDDTFWLAGIKRAKAASNQDWKQVAEACHRLKQENDAIKLPPRATITAGKGFPISARTDAELRAAIDTLKNDPGAGNAFAVKYRQHCETFAAHFFRIHFDPNRPERHLGCVMAFSYDEQHAELRDTAWACLFGGALLTLVIGLGAMGFSRLLTRRLTKITRAAEQIGQGTFDVSLPHGDTDEIDELAGGFRRMIEELQARGKELRDREARLRMIFQSAAEGILSVHEDGTIYRANSTAERMFGYNTAELGRHTVHDLIPTEYHKMLDDSIECLTMQDTSTPSVSFEAEGIRNGGKPFPLDMSISSIRIEDEVLFTFVVRDITDRKQVEQEIRQLNDHLRQLNEELEDRVQQRTADLLQANEELVLARDLAEAASRTKDTFLANMSHELRTPLNAIIGYSEMLEEDAEDAGQQESVADLQKIHKAGKHLLSLINDILDIAKVEAGKMQLHPESFDVADLASDMIASFQFAAQRNSNQLELDAGEGLGDMFADRTRIRQILYNLLSNACKFTKNGSVILRVRRRESQRASRIVFDVRDTGIGMTDEQLSRIFEPFEQADSSTSRKYGGTGLGLAICKRFCTLMNGEIGVSSEPGAGTTFTVELPVLCANPEPIASSGQASTSMGTATDECGDTSDDEGPRVLVIDDDPNVCDLMMRFLCKSGFSVQTVRTGEEGLDIAKTWRPNAITLDALLPGTDGWNILKRLKSDPETHDIPVVMVTILDQAGMGYALGADHYMTKPINWNKLIETLRDHLPSDTNGHVLVVDDDEDVCDLIRRSIEREGWSASIAITGESALQHVAERLPDVILLDLVLPGMHGLDVLTELKQHTVWREIPVVVMTSLQPETDLSVDEQQQLRENTTEVVLKGDNDGDGFLREIQSCVAAAIECSKADDTEGASA